VRAGLQLLTSLELSARLGVQPGRRPVQPQRVQSKRLQPRVLHV
jgi:hypothetical protein